MNEVDLRDLRLSFCSFTIIIIYIKFIEYKSLPPLKLKFILVQINGYAP